jgi:hypothetical protein
LRNHLTICSYSSGNSLNCQFRRAVNFRVAGFFFFGGFAAFGEYLSAHVAAGFGPLVVLLGEDGADEADDGVAAGEDPDHVGAAADLLVEPFLGYLQPQPVCL